jgi:hypothetical protein
MKFLWVLMTTRMIFGGEPDHDTLLDSTTSQPESNSRLKKYSAFDSLLRVMIAFLTSFPF